MTDEFHQSFVPGRTPEIKDLSSDAAGAILAVLIIKIATSFIANRKAKT